MSDWKRPDSVPVPQIWSRFEGKKTIGTNGKIPKFIIQDMTDDMVETTLDHMSSYFLRDEPKARNINLLGNPVTVEEFRALWKRVMNDKLTLVCLLGNKEELGDDALPSFAGCNMTYWKHAGFKKNKMSSPEARKFFEALDKCGNAVDCCKTYNVPGYISAFGLSVDPIYRGQGIGLELLKARFPLGRALGIKLTVTIFSAVESQRLAEKAGFKTFYETDFNDVKDENDKHVFKGIKSKSMKLMGAIIE